MNRAIRTGLLIAIVALIAVSWLGYTRPTQAQSGGGYDLTWSTIDGGGGTSTGGGYSLSGTIGQADAGKMSGGAYSLSGGFWAAFEGILNYLPLIRR